MITQEDANIILQLLNKVAITGHQERNIVNAIVDKLVSIANPKPEKPPEET